MSSPIAIFEAVLREREYQESKWGDNPHSVGEWLLIVEAELYEAKKAFIQNPGDCAALEELLQVIAVGFACLEQHHVFEREEVANLPVSEAVRSQMFPS